MGTMDTNRDIHLLALEGVDHDEPPGIVMDGARLRFDA